LPPAPAPLPAAPAPLPPATKKRKQKGVKAPKPPTCVAQMLAIIEEPAFRTLVLDPSSRMTLLVVKVAAGVRETNVAGYAIDYCALALSLVGRDPGATIAGTVLAIRAKVQQFIDEGLLAVVTPGVPQPFIGLTKLRGTHFNGECIVFMDNPVAHGNVHMERVSEGMYLLSSKVLPNCDDATECACAQFKAEPFCIIR
jgi:hypothetical protein